jgi:hypothetical protein
MVLLAKIAELWVIASKKAMLPETPSLRIYLVFATSVRVAQRSPSA